jgi:EAL domain-containing protein (putative c-di-GMP-specific phosphodiesterase class I)
VCQRIVEALAKPYTIAESELFVSASVGVSLYPGDGDEGGVLLKNADAAMYRAKELGKNQFRYFAVELNVAVQRRHALHTGMRRALSQNLFRLHYQPKMSIADGKLVGAESLLRWTDPELGVVSPAEFIPVAEKLALIGDICVFVVNQVIEDLLAWRAAGVIAPPIAINISPSQLRDDNFAGWLAESLIKACLPSSSVVVELTEGALMEQGEAGLRVLDKLAGQGIKISIDDFGTGYSSLAYLKRMPISELKIDRSFVDGIADKEDDRAIANAILVLAHTLGLSAVAEGVETERQLTILRTLGCDVAQGYLFHKPMDMQNFGLLLSTDTVPASRQSRAA